MKTKLYQYNGELQTLHSISANCGIKYTTLWKRLNSGYSIEEAVRNPLIANSVLDFVESDDPKAWDGMSTTALYDIYDYFCGKYDYFPLQLTDFIKQLRKLVKMRLVSTLTDGGWKQIIRTISP